MKDLIEFFQKMIWLMWLGVKLPLECRNIKNTTEPVKKYCNQQKIQKMSPF